MKKRTLIFLIGCVVTAAIVLTSLLRYRNGFVVSLLARQADAVSDLETRLERNPDDAAAMVALTGVAEDRSMAMQARMFAVEVIGREGRRATPRVSVQALATLRRLASDDSNQLRRSACQALGAMGPRAGEAVDDVIAAMVGGRGMDVEAACAAALGDIASMPEKAIPALANLVSSAEPGSGRPSFIRGEEVDALAKFGVTALRAVPKLEAALSDPDTEYRRKVVSALVKIDPGSEKLPAAAASLLKSDDSVARYFGLKALGDLAGRPLGAEIKHSLSRATCDSSKENADLARSVFARVEHKVQAECAR